MSGTESLYLSLENLQSDPDQLFLLSCRETNGLSERQATSLLTHESLEFDNLSTMIEFEQTVSQKLRKDYMQSLDNKHHAIGKELLSNKNDFFKR